jgi:hypothetical protein
VIIATITAVKGDGFSGGVAAEGSGALPETQPHRTVSLTLGIRAALTRNQIIENKSLRYQKHLAVHVLSDGAEALDSISEVGG